MSGLSKFRVESHDPNSQSSVESREFAPTFFGRIMAVDQSLAKSGVAIFTVHPGGFVEFEHTAVVKSDKSNGKTNPDRTDMLVPQFWDLISTWSPDLLVHETPPVSSAFNRNNRPDSSMAAAVCLRTMWAMLHPTRPFVVVGAQTAKLRWTGQRDATKFEVGSELLLRWPQISTLKPNNQDTRDAIAIGLCAAERTTKKD